MLALCDTNVYLAFFKKECEGFHAKAIFDRALAGEFQIAYCEIVRFEITRKYPALGTNVERLLSALSKNGALFPVEISKEDLHQARELDRRLEKYDFFQKQYRRFGVNDCLFLVLSQKHGCFFVSCEKGLVRAARELGVDAASPTEFIS